MSFNKKNGPSENSLPKKPMFTTPPTTTNIGKSSSKKTLTKGSDNSNGSNNSSNSILPESKRLPRKFAQQLLDLEFEVETGSFTMETISALILLYQQAVEYYNGNNDGKYSYYEARM